MPKFLNGVDILANLIVDSDAAVGATIVDIQGSQGQLFSVTNSLTGDLFSVSDISGVPIINVNSSGAITLDGYIPDNNKLNLGNSNDLQIYHDGSNSYIHDSGTGHLNIKATNLQLLNAAGNKYYLTGADGNDVKIFHNGVEKFATTSTGASVTGGLSATAGVRMGNDTATASADNVGTQRYRATANNSYVEMCMQTAASGYSWVIIKENSW